MKKIVTVFIAFLFLNGCSLAPVQQQNVASYTLNGISQLKLRNKPTHSTLLVSRTIASPGYQTSEMIYTTQPFQLQTFAFNRWVAPPAQMLTPLLVQSLRHTGVFNDVISAPAAAQTSYQLNTNLLSLKQDFTKNPSQIDIQLQVSLINSKTNSIVASHKFKQTMATDENTPYAGVIAANKATKVLMEKIAKFVAHKIK